MIARMRGQLGRWTVVAALVCGCCVVAAPASAVNPRSTIEPHITADTARAEPDVLFTIRLRNATQRRLSHLTLTSSQFWDATSSGSDGTWTPPLDCGPAAGALRGALADLQPQE